MKLVPAPGSQDMQAALSHSYVLKIVSILLQDRELLRVVAKLLQRYISSTPPGLKEALEALIINQSRPNIEGNVAPPNHVIELTRILQALYLQSEQKIKYQRGAILELLAKELVCPRYGSDEICLGNQIFVEQGKPITIKQVDVTALSYRRRRVEGYACKLKVSGLESSDCTNLAYLANAATEQDYYAHVGIISFDNDRLVRIRLDRLEASNSIHIYGLESIERLKNDPF